MGHDRLTLCVNLPVGEIRVSHQEVDQEDLGRDPPAEVVLGRRTQPDLPQRE